MAQRTVFNPPTYSEAANAQQESVRPELQPAVNNFLAQQQLTQARTHQDLADKMAMAQQNMEQLKLDPTIAHLKAQTGLMEAQTELAGRKVSSVSPDVFDLSKPISKDLNPEEATIRASLVKSANFAKTRGQKTPQVHPVPTAEVAKIGQLRSLMDQLQPVNDIYTKSLDTKGDSPFVGPLDSRLQSAKQLTSGANKDFAVFKQNLSGVKNQLLNMLSGAAISPKEYKRLIEALPDESRNEVDFKAKLDGFNKVQDSILKEKLSAFRQAGYDTSGLEGGQIARETGDASKPAADAETRYEELINSGIPEDEAYQKLAEEGF